MSAVLASILLSTLAALAAPFVLAKAIDHIFMGIQEAAVHGTRFHVNVHTVGSYVGCLMILYLKNFIFEICGAVHYVIRIRDCRTSDEK